MTQFEADDQSDGHQFFPVYHSLENKEFSDDDDYYDLEQEPAIFYNEPEIPPLTEEPEELLSPSVAKTVGKVTYFFRLNISNPCTILLY